MSSSAHTAIRVTGLTKQYTIANTRQKNDTLREEIVAGVKAMFSRGKDSERTASFNALNNVSFEIAKGDVVGVIGRNGAGKSTLLKVLSRVTQPTSGKVEIWGRVGSLLEVGTGFDRELTGRENTYLNGAILGMKKREIERKFDEIVAFAEIEKFIDTPVKRYSSGMYTRLAFAVAAHLEPEVLIVDEVLAVGDARFQARCLGKMGEVARQGRTVVFVSHNMAAVTSFCPRSIWLDQGTLREYGDTAEVMSRYLAHGGEQSGEAAFSNDNAPGSDAVRLIAVRTVSAAGHNTNTVSSGESLTVEVEYETTRTTSGLRIGVTLVGRGGETLLSTKDLDVFPIDVERKAGRYISRVELPSHFFNTGQFYVSVGADFPMVQAHFNLDRVLSFSVEAGGDSVGGHIPDGRAGLLRMKLPWTMQKIA